MNIKLCGSGIPDIGPLPQPLLQPLTRPNKFRLEPTRRMRLFTSALSAVSADTNVVTQSGRHRSTKVTSIAHLSTQSGNRYAVTQLHLINTDNSNLGTDGSFTVQNSIQDGPRDPKIQP